MYIPIISPVKRKIQRKMSDGIVKISLTALNMLEYDQVLLCAMHVGSKDKPRMIDTFLLGLLYWKYNWGNKLRKRNKVSPKVS